MKKNLPVDISSFSRMITDGYLYVDKTEQIYNLFKTGGRYFFLSRPRRFGKSLLISTLKEMFLGNKELFKHLWLGKQVDFLWQEHPVIHLDFSQADYETSAELKISLGWMLDRIAEQYQVDISKAYSPKTKLQLLVENLAKKGEVVVLIDEYDKPIVDHIHNTKRANAQRAVLKSFYDGFKGLDRYLRAIFITGVSKFSKTSIFSGLNNLNELSNDPEAAQLVGYTEVEVIENFSDYLHDLAKEENRSVEEMLIKIRFWYNGYQFSEAPIKIYNPFSIVYFFKKRKFQNYWFETGTPSFLIEVIQKKAGELREIENKVFNVSTLGTFRIDKLPLATLFYQTGYLTIKQYDKQFDVYSLGYPNEEIRQSLSILEMSVLTHTESSDIEDVVYRLKYALEQKNIQDFILEVRSLFAKIPFNLHVPREAYYHSIFQVICNLLGFENTCELSSSKGRIDLVLVVTRYIYIFEFKFNKSADEAIKQIIKNRYYEPYLNSGKEIVLVGVAFDIKSKELFVDWSEGALSEVMT